MDGWRGAWEGWKSSTCNSPGELNPAIKLNVKQNSSYWLRKFIFLMFLQQSTLTLIEINLTLFSASWLTQITGSCQRVMVKYQIRIIKFCLNRLMPSLGAQSSRPPEGKHFLLAGKGCSVNTSNSLSGHVSATAFSLPYAQVLQQTFIPRALLPLVHVTKE